ncbi:hypothetical protein [Verrucomicrobium spinosum]|uniref:hypothetical protein n=1 Tax=Verrucomicrobium spinosum TaxID=2736 RepID=UPI0018DBC98C|nr:hypothetical protein [Verrucomicrobium spinosum]
MALPAHLKKALDQGEAVSLAFDPKTGSVSGRVLTPEELEKQHQEASGKFTQGFRPKFLPPLPKPGGSA